MNAKYQAWLNTPNMPEELLSQLKAMNDEQIFSLLAELRDADEDNEEAAIEAWLEDEAHQELVDNWVAAGSEQ